MIVYLAASSTPFGGIAPKTIADESLHSKSALKLDDRCDETSTCRERERERENNSINKKKMEIYLAGGATGNNVKIWKDNAETNPTKPMEVFLAGTNAEKNRANAEGDFAQKISILESFYYMQDWMIPYIRDHWDFLLDSGAFTFLMISKKQHQDVDWDSYLARYIEFIKNNQIDNFIELDIEGIVGMEKMEQMRVTLERETGKQSIPVFHKGRGKDYWLGMVRDYDYVALGGLTNLHKKSDQIPESDWMKSEE